MSCYLFQNDSVYYLKGEGRGHVSFDEILASPRGTEKEVHILVAEADGPVFMERVRQIRQIFPRRAIRTCTPYALALRAFLQMRGLSPAGESCLVADDLGDRFLLTASNGYQAPVTRAILSHDPVRIVEEIRRTQKSVAEQSGAMMRGPVLRILSNNADVIESLDAERKIDAIFFPETFPAFDVLGKVKFPVQLMSPEELVRQKQGDLRRGLIAAGAAAVLLTGAGIMCFSFAQARAHALAGQLEGVLQEKNRLDREEHDLSVLTYRSRLKGFSKVAFMEVFDQFLKCLPYDGAVDRVLLARDQDMRWRFTGIVMFPRQEIFPFRVQGIFKEAQIEHVMVQAKPGLNVTLVLAEDGTGCVRP